MKKTKLSKTRRERAKRTKPSSPDVPYIMRLPDGISLFLEVPGCLATVDRSGEVAFLPEGIRHLDRIRALAHSSLDRPPSPGYITALREALGLTQEEMGRKLGVDKLSVSRWERGTTRPGSRSLKALDRLRRRATRKGVKIAS